MKKILSLVLLSFFLLVSCSNATPTEVINAKFTNISNEFDEYFDSELEEVLSSYDSSTENDIKKALEKTLDKLSVTVTNESITDNTATVEVKITGISLKTSMSNFIYNLESPENYYTLLDLDSEERLTKIIDIFIETLDNSEPEERTTTIYLTKSKGNWDIDEVEDDDTMSYILFGLTNNDMENIEKDLSNYTTD